MAARILSQRQFNPRPSLFQRVGHVLNQWLAWLLDRLDLGSYSNSWVSDAIVVALAVGVVVAVAVAARRGVFRRLSSPGASPGVLVTDGGVVLTPEAWRREAGRLAAEGRYREALRCRYRAVVGELAQRGVIDEVPGRTSGDYERLVNRLLPGVSARFSALTASFERCWYGREPSDASGQAAFDEIARSLVADVDANLHKGSVGTGHRGPRGPWPRDELVAE